MNQFFLDSHCHLDAPEFDADRDAVIDRARAAGLKYLLTVGGGGGADELAAGVPIAAKHDWIYTAVGIHPHEAAQAGLKHLELLRESARSPKVIAIGEIGLDYHYDQSPRGVQQHLLIEQLQIARELRLPVIIHCRDAWDDLRTIIEAHWAGAGLGGVLHCFTGERADAFSLMDAGFLVSFTGNLTFKKAENLRSVAREIPLDRLLAETDCPYLAPEPNRGKRNEPVYVIETIRRLAEIRAMPMENVSAAILQNFEKHFGL